MEARERVEEIKRRVDLVNDEIRDLIIVDELFAQIKLSDKGEWELFRAQEERRALVFSEFFEEDIPWLLEKAKGGVC